MRAGLASGAEDAKNFDVLPGQEFGGDGRSGGGADFGEIVGGECEFWAGGMGIEQEVGGVDFLLGGGSDHDEFYAEGRALAVVAGHDEEGAVVQIHLSAERHEGGGIAVVEGFFDGGDDAGGIEVAADVAFGDGGHGE